jgi:hypothetical protein
MTFLQAVTGRRDDLELASRWWHRLATVAYAVAFAAVAVMVLLLAFNSVRPAAEMRNVEVVMTLRSLWDAGHRPSTNLAETLAATGGELGVTRKDGNIAYLNRYFLEQSFCSTHVLQAPEAVAAYFNKVNWTQQNTVETAIAGPLKDVKPGEDGLCWFHKQVQELLDAEVNSEVIAYRFTPVARARAAAGPVAQAVAALLILHVLTVTLYYRGFVYIVCGPRKRGNSE